VLVIGGLIWSVLVVVPVTVKGEGILLSPGGVLDVTSDTPGRVTQFLVQAGEGISAGQIVARLDQPSLRQDLATAEGELKDAQDERRRVADFQQNKAAAQAIALAQKRQALNDNIITLANNIALLEQRGKVEDDLLVKGLITQDKVLQGKIDLGRQNEELARDRTSLKDIDNEEIKTRADNQHEPLNIELKIATAQRKANGLADRYRLESAVVSPYEGTVAEVQVNPGELVERGTSLFTLVPKDAANKSDKVDNPPDGAAIGPLVAVLYVAPTFGKQVRPGDVVQVAVSTARREEFGFIVGRVRTVAAIVLTGLLLLVPGLAIPGLQRAFTDFYLIAGLDHWLKWLLGGMVAAALLRMLLVWLQQFSLSRFNVRLGLVSNGRLLWHVLPLPMNFFAQRNGGELANRASLGDRLSGLMSGSLLIAIVNLLAITIYGAVMLSYDLLLTSMVVGFAVLNLSLLILMTRRLSDSQRSMLQEEGRLQALLCAALSLLCSGERRW